MAGRRPRLPVEVDRAVRARAGERCEYCHAPQLLVPVKFEIDHVRPVADGGGDEAENLSLACSTCNAHKSGKLLVPDPDTAERVPLFNPRTQRWPDHFRWSDDGLRVVGLTPVGRATVFALHLDCDRIVLDTRAIWIADGRHPPPDDG